MNSPTSPLEVAKTLLASLSPSAQLLIDPKSLEFKESMKRWSDADIKIPSAIVKPASEDDVCKIVKTATANNIPFVAKSGGHSPWSTIGPSGWIIDLSLLTSITLNLSTPTKTATISAGTLTKPLNHAVAAAGYHIQTPTAASVGYIPFLLGGGQSWMSGLYGQAVDDLVEARVVVASGEVVTVSRRQNAELFWGLKGAGWFFGIVVSAEVRIWEEREIWDWTVFFEGERAGEVAGVLEGWVDRVEMERSPGMVAIAIPPGQSKPMIIINLKHFRPLPEATQIMAPLLSLKPLKETHQLLPFANTTDATDKLNAQGGFKSFASCALPGFSAKRFQNAVKIYGEMVRENEGTRKSSFMFTWIGTRAMMEGEGRSAFSGRDCGGVFMGVVNTSDIESYDVGVMKATEVVEMCQADQREDEKAMVPNHTRGDNIEQRYRGTDRLRRLRALKMEWDPKGIFTDQFL